MKKYNYLLLSFLLLSFTSCLKGNLDDLPEFDVNDITGVQRVEYRYISNEISNVSGQPITKFVTLDNKATVNPDNKTVDIKVTVPAANNGNFPASEREKCTIDNIAVMISVSTAARVTPIGNSPKLGTPGDWSRPNKYNVQAANGKNSEWTITISSFNK